MTMKTVEHRWVVSQCPAPGERIYKDNSGPGLGKLLHGVGVRCPYITISGVYMSGCQECLSVPMSGCQDVRMSGVYVSGCQDV